MLASLRRVGIPDKFVKVISGIYAGKVFEVRVCGVTSEQRAQNSGICQGCPLSPFLFIIGHFECTTLMHDARRLLNEECLAALGSSRLYDVL